VRIAIASTVVPFIRGGGTMIVDSLAQALRERGHTVAEVRLPLWSYWQSLPAQTVGIRALDLSESCGERIDRLITIRYPSYALKHEHKLAWFIHHHRGAYDLWDTEYRDLPLNEEGHRYRDMFMRSDTIFLRECRKIFTNSRTVADRLRRFNSIEPDRVLYPPLPNPELFHALPAEDFFLYASRLSVIKRQEVAIRAMQYVRSPFKLVLVGTPDVEWYQAKISELVERCGVADKVVLTGWIDEKEKADLTARCISALYVPFEEDSYGYPTLEAFHSRKAILTFHDSGGTNEVVRHGVNGMVLDPAPEALAEAMESLWSDRPRAARMGEAAYQTLQELNINWDYVVDHFTS
jgi:glycosyltransferase involved in cell wall biosynthesis